MVPRVDEGRQLSEMIAAIKAKEKNQRSVFPLLQLLFSSEKSNLI